MKFECVVCGAETGVLFFESSLLTAKEIGNAIIITDEGNVRVFCWCDKCNGIQLHKILDGELTDPLDHLKLGSRDVEIWS